MQHCVEAIIQNTNVYLHCLCLDLWDSHFKENLQTFFPALAICFLHHKRLMCTVNDFAYICFLCLHPSLCQ